MDGLHSSEYVKGSTGISSKNFRRAAKRICRISVGELCLYIHEKHAMRAIVAG